MIKSLGISTYLFVNEKLSERHLLMVSERGIGFLEIWGVLPHFNYNDNAYISEIGKLLEKYQLNVNSLHTTSGLAADMDNVSIFSSDEQERTAAIEEVKKQIDALALLKGKIAIIHPGGKVPEEERGLRLGKSKDSVKKLLEYSAARGIKIAIENTLDRAICWGAEELREYVDSFQSENIGICFDTSHANLTQDIFIAGEICRDKIITLHLSDNFGERDDHLVPFCGKIDWPRFLNILKSGDYHGIFTFEIAPSQNPEGTIRSVVESYRRFDVGGA